MPDHRGEAGRRNKDPRKRVIFSRTTLISFLSQVVFLQEVVPETLPLIKDRLPRYQVIPQVDQESGFQRKDAYFTAVLIKRFCVYLVRYQDYKISYAELSQRT